MLEVKPTQIEDGIIISGELRPIEEVIVRSRVEGNLTSVLVREGDRVARGQLHYGTGDWCGRRLAVDRFEPNLMNDELKSDIKQAIVRSLKLPIRADEIEDSAPLFGAGLGLDSIDALELVLELERSFGVVIGDEETGSKVLRSVDAIAEFIQAQKSA